jgi:hypothetical protein
MYFGGLEALAQAYDPLMKGLARTQLELIGLANRRVQAVLELPARFSQCRTPQDMANEQARFWRTAFEEYTEGFGRMTEAVASFVPTFGFSPEGDAQSAHDYITFPETKEPSRGSPRDRKAA